MSRPTWMLAALAAFSLAVPLAGHAAPPPSDKTVLLPTAVGRPASDLVMLVDNGPVTPSQGFPGLTYISFARVHGDGTVEPSSYVVPAGKVLVLTSASGSLAGVGDVNATVTFYAWAQPDGAVRGLYGNNYRTNSAGFADIRIDFGSGFVIAPGYAILAISPVANIGLNFQGYLADQ